MNKYGVFALVAIVLLISGLVIFLGQRGQQQPSMPSGLEIKQEDSLIQGKGSNADEQQEGLTYYQGTILAGKGGAPLLDFTKSDYEQALAANKIILLYFYANWCPICRVEVPNELYPAFNELVTDKVVGFRINYNDSDTDDSEKALAKEFGITYQHTKVILKNGKEVLKDLDSWDKERYLQEINKVTQ